MRKIFLLLVVVAVLGAGWFLVRPSGPAPVAYSPRGPGDVYLALGDSLAWGARLDQRETESYPALLHAGLSAERTIELVNLSVPGETSATFLRGQLARAVETIARVRAEGRRVSPISLDIGGNDVRAGEQAGLEQRAAIIETVRRNLGRILDELRAAAPDADIVVMTYYNPYGGDPAVAEGAAAWVERLNAAISDETARRGGAVADAYTPFTGGNAYSYTYILLGDIHANAQGHRVIAEAFRAALRYDEMR